MSRAGMQERKRGREREGRSPNDSDSQIWLATLGLRSDSPLSPSLTRVVDHVCGNHITACVVVVVPLTLSIYPALISFQRLPFLPSSCSTPLSSGVQIDVFLRRKLHPASSRAASVHLDVSERGKEGKKGGCVCVCRRRDDDCFRILLVCVS